MEGRLIAALTTLPKLKETSEELAEHRGPTLTAHRPHEYPGYSGAWPSTSPAARLQLMPGRLRSENNIPVVGREQVIKSREMHWLRATGTSSETILGNPGVVSSPCVRDCEFAPCE